MKKRIITLILIAISFSGIIAQENRSLRFEFLPSGLHFIPLKANFDEARMGVFVFTGSNDLKVDIGNNVDLLALHIPSFNSKLTLAVEFMAYAYTTSFAGNRLQVDAIDGFFGGNISFSKQFYKSKLISRLRIIHNSSHFVDGHYDSEAGDWINGDIPIPFAKDYGELLLGHQFYPEFGSIKFYGAVSYAWLVRPHNLYKWAAYFGYELSFKNVIGKVFGHDTHLFIANHISGVGLPKYVINNHFMGGIKFGEWDDKGLVIYASYYIGANMFNEYFYERVRKFGIGFLIDFI